MSSIYHRHRGGNHPHVHRHDDGGATPHHHHGGTHHHDHHDDHGHGYHAYDVHGHQPAVIQADPRELNHWHFDRPFEHVALLPVRTLCEESAATDVAFTDHDSCCLPQAPRPPPDLA